MKNLILKKGTILLMLLSCSISLTFGQTINQQFFTEANNFFSTKVVNKRVNYTTLQENASLINLISQIEKANLTNATAATKKAFYINAYNLHVINAVAQAYPIKSVQDIAGFFDKQTVRIGGEAITLNQLEKEYLLAADSDPRLHFVLVCGAIGCPPITNFAYQPEQLETQLSQQTTLALDDAGFLQISENKLRLSQLFKWYASDFGGDEKAIIGFINKYRTNPVPTTAKVDYYPYNWQLNETSSTGGKSPIALDVPQGNRANANRYIVSSAIPQGTVELKVFNNLYTQRTGSPDELTDRADFFTTTLTALYGLVNRFNIGINTRFRRVRNDKLPSSPFEVFSNEGANSTRQRLTAVGPQIRYAPFPSLKNFSVQSSYLFPVGENLQGINNKPFIDWNGADWNTQFFNDFPLGNNFSLFTEIDFLIEDIGAKTEGHVNRISTPVTAIFSYNPNPKTILYTIGSYSPYWTGNDKYFYQYGLGGKYQFTPDFEIELLLSDFTNKFLNDTGGQAVTYNLGLRVNLFN